LFPLFAASVVDTGGKFAAGVADTGGKLPPVSTTIGKLVAKFAPGVIDNGGKFAAGVCSAQTQTRIGLLEEIPRSGFQIPFLYYWAT
jgi:hypothetical protein